MVAVVRDRNSEIKSLERFEVIRGQISQKRKIIRERKRIEAILRAVIIAGFILILLLGAYSVGFTNASSKQAATPRGVSLNSVYIPPVPNNSGH